MFKYKVAQDLFSLGPYCYLLKNAALSHMQISDPDLKSAPVSGDLVNVLYV